MIPGRRRGRRMPLPRLVLAMAMPVARISPRQGQGGLLALCLGDQQAWVLSRCPLPFPW